jgi:hypothetical protein
LFAQVLIELVLEVVGKLHGNNLSQLLLEELLKVLHNQVNRFDDLSLPFKGAIQVTHIQLGVFELKLQEAILVSWNQFEFNIKVLDGN